MDINLAGKSVLVTGGSRGIGAAIVHRLVDAGARVILHYGSNRQAAERIASAIGVDRCIALQGDLAAPDGSTLLWSQAVQRFDRIDVVVCNAALVNPLTVDDTADAWNQNWTETLQVNVRSVADLCRAAILHYRDKGGGMIINMASRAAFRGDDPHLMHYAASKGAVVALTRSIARNYAKDGVLAYIVAPGFVRTERQEDVIRKRGEELMVRDIPLGEMCSPLEIANVVTFLASGLARHATGATIDINGASYFH